MARQMIGPDASGYQVDGTRMPMPSTGGIWRNPSTGKLYHAVIDEHGAYWIEQSPITRTNEREKKTMVGAMEKLYSLDAEIAAIREDYQREIKALQDQLLAASLEKTLLQSQLDSERASFNDQLKTLRSDLRKSERLLVMFLTQFSTVEQVFSNVKDMVLAHREADTDETGELETASTAAETPAGDQLEKEIAGLVNPGPPPGSEASLASRRLRSMG